MGSGSSKRRKERVDGDKVTYEVRMEETHTKYNFLGFKSSEQKKTLTKTHSVPASLHSASGSLTGPAPMNALKY